MIRVPVVFSMREAPYHNELVARHFFKKIKHLSANNKFSHDDFMPTATSYFDFETGSTKAQSEAVALSIQCAFFFIDNLEKVDVTDYRNKLIIVDPQAPTLEPTYFMFRSIINETTID